MHEIGLIYKGKKKPFQYDNPRTGKLRFTPGVVTWIPAKSAEFLMAVNPSMFNKVGERGPQIEEIIVDDAEDIIKNKALRDAEDAKENEALNEVPAEEAPTETEPEDTTGAAEGPGFLICEKCGRKYHKKYQKWYDQHIAKCEG